MLSIEEIKNISFRKASFGGYKPEDVDAFIDQVLITMEQLRKEKSDLIKKMDILATRVEEYRADEDSVRNALLSAQKVADNTVKDARSKAARMIEESENLAKAKLYDLNVQIKQQKKQYTLLLAECNRVREEIINNCNKHIVIANELPSAERIQSLESSMNDKYPTDNSNDYERAHEFSTPLKEKAQEQDSAMINDEEPVKVANDSPELLELISESPQNSAVSVDNNNVPAEKISKNDTDVNLVEDFSDRDNFDIDHHQKREKKKSKGFGVLKFGDDYNLDNDDSSNNN